MNDDRQQKKILKESQRGRDLEAEHEEDGLTILIRQLLSNYSHMILLLL